MKHIKELTAQKKRHIVGQPGLRLKVCKSWGDPEGGQGVQTPLKNHKNIGFPSNNDPDPLNITKLPSQHSMVGHYRRARETPLQWCFAYGPMMAHF